MTIKKHDALKHIDERLFMSDGGLETTLIFHEKMELPQLAAFAKLR